MSARANLVSTCSVIVLLLMPTSTLGQAAQRDWPLPMRILLSRVAPLMRDKKVGEARKLIQAFQARGGPPPATSRLDPKGYHHPEVYFILGNCYLLQKSYHRAAKAYRQAISRDPTYASAWLNLARAYYRIKQYAKSGHSFARGYQTAARKDPQSLYSGAVMYLMARKPVLAIGLLERLFALQAAAIKPRWREIYIQALLETGRVNQALPMIRSLVEGYSGDKRVRWQEILLHQYIKQGQSKEALTLARSLTDRDPTRARWWKALGYLHLDAGRYEEALAALIIYSYIEPLTSKEQKLLADLYLQLGIPSKAVALYESYLEKKKPDRQLMQRLGMAYHQLGQ